MSNRLWTIALLVAAAGIVPGCIGAGWVGGVPDSPTARAVEQTYGGDLSGEYGIRFALDLELPVTPAQWETSALGGPGVHIGTALYDSSADIGFDMTTITLGFMYVIPISFSTHPDSLSMGVMLGAGGGYYELTVFDDTLGTEQDIGDGIGSYLSAGVRFPGTLMVNLYLEAIYRFVEIETDLGDMDASGLAVVAGVRGYF